MRKYATQRLIAKDVPVHLKGLFEGQNLRFRGRGSRVKAVERVMNSKALRDKYLWELEVSSTDEDIQRLTV